MYQTLQNTYKQWQDLQSKGELKMRVKVDKDHKQYYDFDFSRYQYYYNYPDDHFAFLPPQKQQEFLKQVLKDVLNSEHQGFRINKADHFNKKDNSPPQSHFQPNNQQDNHEYCQSFQYLKPYELQEFIYDYRQRIIQKITCLRIKKSLYTPMKVNEYLKDTEIKHSRTSAIIELIQTEIRSYLSKLTKIGSFDFQFGKSVNERFQQKKSHLKTSNRDEIHFAPVEKTDFVIYERLVKTDGKIVYPIKCMKEEVRLMLKLKYLEIKRKAYMDKVSRMAVIYEQQKLEYNKRRELIISWLTENQPFFLEQFSNVSAIDQFLKNVTYTHKLSATKSTGYLDINLHYKGLYYVPSNKDQLNVLVSNVCAEYFDREMLDDLLGKGSYRRKYSEEHFCYKLIRLGSTVFRITQQTYDMTDKKQDRDLMSKRVLMRRQLETVFAKDINRLLNIPQHESVHLCNYQNNYEIPQLHQSMVNGLQQKQLIFEQFFKSYQFQDAFLYSLGNLLFVRKEKNIHDFVDDYVDMLAKKQVFGNKLQHLMLYYDNIHNDPKNHLINIINKKLSLSEDEQQNPIHKKLLTIIKTHNLHPQKSISKQLVKSLYFLRIVSIIKTKNNLLEILNGQINIMYKVKHKLEYLKKKGQLKFELSKQWLTRFTETNEKKDDPFDFGKDVEITNNELSFEAHTDKLIIKENDEFINQNAINQNETNHENRNYQVQVRRLSPQNPLYQGKKIIYQQAIKQTEQLIQERLLKLGSWCIEKRQNYLHGEELTHIVDRVQLLHELIEKETRYQMGKLKLMQEYLHLFETAVNPSGIQQLTLKIYTTKSTQFSISLNQTSFTEQYDDYIKNNQLKLRLLKLSISLLQRTEHNQKVKVKDNAIRKNINHNLPEISSIYYHQATKSNNQQIQQEKQSDQEDDLQLKFPQEKNTNKSKNASENQQSLNNKLNQSRSESLTNSVIVETSTFSQSLHNKSHYKHSDYHVKKSFRQILNMNETKKVQQRTQKKQLLLNRKKKRILNDTVLGKLLFYDENCLENNNQKQSQKCKKYIPIAKNYIRFSQYAHHAIEIIQMLEHLFETIPTKYKEKFIQNQALSEVIKCFEQQQIIIEGSNTKRQITLQSEELLPLSLHSCSKLLLEAVQRIKNNEMNTKASDKVKNYAWLEQKVIENIIQNKTSDQINGYRGLYLGLNHVQLMKLMNTSLLNRHRQDRLLHYISELVSSYSQLKLANTKQTIFLGHNLLQSPLVNSKCQLYKKILQNEQTPLRILGQYSQYIKLSHVVDELFSQYHQLLINNLTQNYVEGFQSLLLEMELMYKSNSWFSDGTQNGLDKINSGRIENKVWIGKKVQAMVEMRKLLFSKETMTEYLHNIPTKLISQSIHSFYEHKETIILNSNPNIRTQKQIQSTILNQSRKFSNYLQQLFGLVSRIIVVNSRLYQKLANCQKIRQIQELVKILPLLNEKIIITRQESVFFQKLFHEDLIQTISVSQNDKKLSETQNQNNNEKKSIQIGKYSQKDTDNFQEKGHTAQQISKQNKNNNISINISYTRLKADLITRLMYYLSSGKQNNSDSSQNFNGSHNIFMTKLSAIFHELTHRKYPQFKSEHEIENQKKYNTNYIFKTFKLNPPFDIAQLSVNAQKQISTLIPSPQLQQHQRLTKLTNHLHTKLLLFSLTELNPQEQIQLKILLYTKRQSFTIFWKDETSNLVKAPQFVKLKSMKLQSQDLLQKYRQQYLTYFNLKNKYKSLIDKLKETPNLEHQMQDTLYVFVNAMYFLQQQQKLSSMVCNNNTNQTRQYFKYLFYFGNQFEKPDKLKEFFTCILSQRISLSQISKHFNFHYLKKSLLNTRISQSKYNLFRQFQQRSLFLRQHINNLRLKKQPQINSELFHFNIMKFIMTKILKSLDIDSTMHRQKLEIFSKKFTEKVNENIVMLTQKERHILEMPPMNSDVRSRFQALKDEAIQGLYFLKYFEQILLNKMYEISNQILNGQLELKKCLGDCFEQRQLSMDSKVYTETFNKVLAPKVMLNPFLNSPLLIDNYFFAGTLKLSYIDQFLNRMKNRAIMVEMAEGGFAFLLKVSQLDESVNALCKGIVAFSQKQFHDRLRTYFEYVDELKQKLKKLQSQNNRLKSLNKLNAFYDEKQIKSLLYEKLHSYIQCITEKEKTYKNLFSMFKNLENDLMKQCSQKYENKIKSLEEQNFVLKKTFKDFEQKIKKSAISNVNESCDTLFSYFKQKFQKVLNKQFIPQYEEIQRPSFIQNQAYESEILLQKLKQQSIVSKLKTNLTNKQYEKRITQLQKKLVQKEQLINEIKQQRQKSYHLKNEVKQLANKAIEVEALQKRRKVDLEERMMEKFKLIRVNQALQGKLVRLQSEFGRTGSILDDQKKSRIQKLSHKNDSSFRKTVNSQMHFTKQKQQQSVFVTRQPKKRSHTQFGMQTITQSGKKDNGSLIKSRVRKTPVVLVKQMELTKSVDRSQQQHKADNGSRVQNVDEARVWRQRWQKSESKYQKLVEVIKQIGENFKITKNGRKVGEKIMLLLDELNCESVPRKPQLNELI